MAKSDLEVKSSKAAWSLRQVGLMVVMLAAIVIFQVLGIANRAAESEVDAPSNPVNTVELTSEGVTLACTAGTIFDGHVVKYPGTITGVYFSGDGTSSDPYVITVDGQIDPIVTYDDLFEDNMLQAAALAGVLKDDERVNEIIWRGSARATSTGQHFTVVVETKIQTDKAPDAYMEADKVVDYVESYDIAGVVYARLDNYAFVDQRKH